MWMSGRSPLTPAPPMSLTVGRAPTTKLLSPEAAPILLLQDYSSPDTPRQWNRRHAPLRGREIPSVPHDAHRSARETSLSSSEAHRPDRNKT